MAEVVGAGNMLGVAYVLLHWAPVKRVLHEQRAAFSLVEALISLSCIGAFAGALVFGLLHMNRFAATERNRSSARQLCQERIEQVLSIRYSPENNIVPSILAGATQEDVVIYAPQNSGSAVPVSGKRITTVSPATGVDASLKVLSVTVQVTYTGRGKNQSFTMSTLRSPD